MSVFRSNLSNSLLKALKKARQPRQALYLPEALISSESSPSLYSLFPFSPPQPLSWQTPPGSTFRYRRIGTWTDAARLPHSDTSGALADALDSMASSARYGASVSLLHHYLIHAQVPEST